MAVPPTAQALAGAEHVQRPPRVVAGHDEGCRYTWVSTHNMPTSRSSRRGTASLLPAPSNWGLFAGE